MAGAALPAIRFTRSASQQLHAVRLPGHAKSDGTSKRAPKRLLSLFLSLPCYFGHGLLSSTAPFANSVAFRPAHARPPAPPPPLLPKRALYIGRLTHGLSQPASLLRGASAPGLGIVSVGLRSPHFAAQTLGYWFLMAVERCFAVIGQRLTPLFGARHDRVEEEVLDINQQASGSSTAMLEKSPATLASPQYMGTSYRACSLPRIRSEWAFEARSRHETGAICWQHRSTPAGMSAMPGLN